MSKSLNTWEGRRALTDNASAGAETLKKAARELMEINLLSDAADFFKRAGDDEGLHEIINQAVREGNFFIFKEASSKLSSSLKDRAKLEALMETAENNGQMLYLEQAERYLKDYL
ncbi:MAG: hypothetical protein LBS31_07365 [Candidatus Adiutrix sp.]|jgi:hypothetical protein|nr:hypothetical protein [Candidatus Adiutrix sp.]